jgi:hypothetical protein
MGRLRQDECGINCERPDCDRRCDKPGDQIQGPLRAGERGNALVHRSAVSRKVTIAHALAEQLRTTGERVQVLDGDEVRPHLSAGLGFSRAGPRRQRHQDRLGRTDACLSTASSCWCR